MEPPEQTPLPTADITNMFGVDQPAPSPAFPQSWVHLPFVVPKLDAHEAIAQHIVAHMQDLVTPSVVRSFRFRIDGRPTPQGSKRAFVVNTKAGPRAVQKESGGANLEQWRDNIARITRELAPIPPINGHVALGGVFHQRRPKGHYGSKAGQPYLKPGQPVFSSGKNSGDIEKHLRSLNDALVAAQWMLDDWQVKYLLPVQQLYVDAFTGQEGATILLLELDNTTEAPNG